MQSFAGQMALAFQDELEKLKQAAAPPAKSMLVPGLAAGALGMLALQRAHRDWRMGRAMRLQQNTY